MLSKVDFIQTVGNGKDIIRWYSCSDIVIEGALDTEFDWHCISLVKGQIYFDNQQIIASYMANGQVRCEYT